MKIKSLKGRILLSFYILTLIPTIIVASISLNNTIQILEKNFNTMTQNTLAQVNKNVNLSLDSSRDLLYQMYVDDTIVKLVDDLNHGENTAIARSQLLRKVREIANLKPYIESIMIIPKDGETLFFDKLTAASTKSSWMEEYPINIEEMYKTILKSNDTIVYPTKLASTLGGNRYYFFHAGHRIIDYKDVEKELGVVLFTFNQKILDESCNEISYKSESEIKSINFLLNEDGEIMSFPLEEYLDTKIGGATDTKEERIEKCKIFIEQVKLFQNKDILINYVVDEKSNWTIVNVADQGALINEIKTQKMWIFIMIISLIVVLGIVGWLLMSQLTVSIEKVVATIRSVSQGDLSRRIQIDKKMPEEIRSISENFNAMLIKLNTSIENEKIATEKQRQSEIGFLEAQINPHFLYNTLDTINWMAIDEEQYAISEAVNSLARILRYGIDKSSKAVAVKEEIDWLKQYILLQQYRLKSELNVKINVEPHLLQYKIYKLLLQPFVENAIKHGFKNEKEKFMLSICISEEKENIIITIEDNGQGMSEEKRKELMEKMQTEQNIGIRNAVERIEIYYGKDARVNIKSEEGIGTIVTIRLPVIE